MAITVDVVRGDRLSIVKIVGRIDVNTAAEVQSVCLSAMQPGDAKLVLDLAGVPYISSAGLGSILVAGKKMDQNGGKLILCCVDSWIKQVFQYSGFDTLFPICESTDAAVALT